MQQAQGRQQQEQPAGDELPSRRRRQQQEPAAVDELCQAQPRLDRSGEPCWKARLCAVGSEPAVACCRQPLHGLMLPPAFTVSKNTSPHPPFFCAVCSAICQALPASSAGQQAVAAWLAGAGCRTAAEVVATLDSSQQVGLASFCTACLASAASRLRVAVYYCATWLLCCHVPLTCVAPILPAWLAVGVEHGAGSHPGCGGAAGALGLAAQRMQAAQRAGRALMGG